MDKKYQIFVSSTFADLVEERQSVSRAILDMGHIPAGMEMFPATDVEQLTYIKKVIDECDYYVLIIGARYGSLDEEGVSYTEREFQYAVDTGKTVLAFLHRNMDSVPLGKTDKDDSKRRKLDTFIASVSSGRLVQFWESAVELKAYAIVSLTKAFSENPQVGWVRADKIASESTMADIIKYRNENDGLRSEIVKIKSSLKPIFDDAADLTAMMKIEFTYTPSSSSSSILRKSHVDISFQEFLKWISPDLHTPGTVLSACAAITRALKERRGFAGRNFATQQAAVNDGLLHLVATGHLKMWASKTAGGQHVTGYQLTELGVRTWQEMSYIKAGYVESD